MRLVAPVQPLANRRAVASLLFILAMRNEKPKNVPGEAPSKPDEGSSVVDVEQGEAAPTVVELEGPHAERQTPAQGQAITQV